MSSSTLSQFRFQPEKVRTGMVYHYVKSNMDGSYPAQVYIREMDGNQLDVWKFEQHNADAAHVTAHMDWTYFSADSIRSAVVTADGSSRMQAELSAQWGESKLTVQLGEMKDTLKVPHLPTHVYNFDFISLNIALRHWIHAEGEIVLGVVQPNFTGRGDALMNFEGTVSLRYVCDEERHHTACRRYVIEGEGLQGTSGSVWVNQEFGHVEDMEIPIPDNPDWDDFKFEFVKTAQMPINEWEAFIHGQIGKLKNVRQ